MKIYGPFHALNNPLVMASMAVNVLNLGIKGYNEYADAEDKKFLAASLLRGYAVPEMQGGYPRRGLSWLTHGLVSPMEHPSSEGLINEELAVREQRAKALGEYTKYATTFGTGAPDGAAPGAAAPATAP